MFTKIYKLYGGEKDTQTLQANREYTFPTQIIIVARIRFICDARFTRGM
jgi:hypothetical protein